ncbi:GNAT family N-acetyltransferase [Bradyrhizobium sp. JYMT SZCCT0180]|uniref:GNAT family N-acetyltransferase n=1 Tax=Bradyrhizobium sp. JYMT SZCCT0180 TaxID=2807666 RepID=UPI001BA81AE4|nr:GNAT family N-acetyltransferase [Bradyrhizobium sp. JYMT SZCCT0180]MBR1209826.1 GNAT family N-acetyltransferase [Bradyrhizobium sp. JYMT SZCCT0180]
MSDRDASEHTGPNASRPVVGKLDKNDLPEAARIVRLAFGTFIGAPDPETFWADRDYVYGRQRAAHVASFGATLDGKFVGSNFATNWGSVGFLGPLTVRPDVQGQGIAGALLAKTMEQFETWGTRHVGLFTFSDSAKHIALYQKYGFYARFLTAIMSAKAVRQTAAGWLRFSELSQVQREEALQSCRDVAETIYPGLDLSGEISATHSQGLGDIALVEGARGIAAFAVCHYGPRSEAGADTCFVKFGAVRDGGSAERDYLRLLDACEAMAVAAGMSNLLAGANMARHEAYQHLVAREFRSEILGVTMHRQNDPGYCRPGAYIIDDWR